ncbi:hypothetical protein C8R47DRAFT_979100 [Mycena vitilis]|nr:hypothetical protein C8R47DRAFT_979100 [Mycena vitilis]
MSGFPRACFSEKELNATRWYAAKNGVSSQPTIKKVKNHRQDILNVAGLNTKLIDGKLGNSFALNDWFKILEHEFANPLIRPKLHLYPEDSGDRLEEGRQAAKWKQEVNGNISGPMARGHGGKDYYVEEICFARLDGAGGVGPVMPTRWFTRNGELVSVAHPLHLTPSQSAFVIDGSDRACLEIPLSHYFLNVLDLEDSGCQARYGPMLSLEDWPQPSINPWRLKANGRRCHSAPLWTYCDDTSGNVSKKWNKHNSILFTLAGLPRALTQMLYNIHFIATSNLSPPLEMMEAVVAMLKEAQDTGIEVWDCVYQEWILIIPWFLAFQGDNPMASEFASHVGMKGKYFCRVCKAKSDKANRAPGNAGEIDRLKEFMTAGVPRTKKETVADLTAQLQRAVDGAPSAVDDMATESGSKDKYFQHYLDELQAAASKLREEQKEAGPGPSEAGIPKRQQIKDLLARLRAEMPTDIFNPVLSIDEFDANSDTPVEILHVVLLGVVKYWWRDAVSRQNSKGKEELKARLSSVDVAGLNTPPIRGNTYVQYAGSLVGRDFRVILQVALVVLHGLIPQAHYDGWVALCTLAPLMFQPAIENLPSYIEKLNAAVFEFLAATALWNTQWFNKPKFHLFSFNLVIRLRSIHSSKHAPSIDIATAFSHLHAIRHLVSGGFVLVDVDGNNIAPRQAGPEVLALLGDEQFLRFMSMEGLADKSESGGFLFSLHVNKNTYISGVSVPLVGIGPCPWRETIASTLGISTLLTHSDKVQRCKSLILGNEDKIEISKYVIYRKGSHCVGRVEEILVDPETDTVLGAILSVCKIGADILPYRLPSCTVQPHRRLMIAFKVSPSQRFELICAVNVNHNCSAHGCKATPTRRVVQERQQTDSFGNEVNHVVDPHDCFLNLAQLRSATDVQKLRSGTRFPGLSLTDTIERSIENKERLEREAKQAEAAKESERQEKAAAKQAKATSSGLEPAQKQNAADKNKGKKRAAGAVGAQATKSAGAQGRGQKRRRNEEDRDFAEGGEDLQYNPRPSKSRAPRQTHN